MALRRDRSDPGWLLPYRDRAAAFAGLPAGDFGHALLIRYDPGAGIGWHRDRPVFDQVLGISLGAPTILNFRQRTASGFRRAKLALPPRCAYHLSGEVRQEWEQASPAMMPCAIRHLPKPRGALGGQWQRFDRR